MTGAHGNGQAAATGDRYRVHPEAAAQASDLIALATHGRGGLTRLLRGSVADQLVRAAASPVLVYRPSGEGR